MTVRTATEGVGMLQLTTDKRRPEALGFYEGMKLHLTTATPAAE